MLNDKQNAPVLNGELVLSPLGQAALDYGTNYGWPVFPCYSITDDGVCTCGDRNCSSPGKHPSTGAGGFHHATTAAEQIEEWWQSSPEANIGIPTGAASGFDVVDVDLYKNGDTLEALRNGQQLPTTPTAETGRGGMHILFKHEDGQKGRIGDGLDWKGDGGYVIVSPSRGALQPYQWKVPPTDVDLARLPDWLRREEKKAAASDQPVDWEAKLPAVRKALTFIDPAAPRDTWLKVGMAIHHASGGADDGFALWHSWGAGELHDDKPANYSSQRDHAERWHSFSSGTVTLGTLFRLAAEHGFNHGPDLKFGEKSSDTLPELPTAKEFLKRSYPEPEFLIGPIRNQNIVIIHGPTGVGKTQLGAAMARALGTGTSWLHWEAQRPCRLLFIDAELPPGDLQYRLTLHDVSNDSVRVLNAIELDGMVGQGGHLNLADAHWQDIVWAYVSRYQSEVVLVDNVMSAVSVPGTSMASDEFWKPAYDLALKWRGAGLTSIWFDHSNSAGKIFGTKVKTWNADLVVQLSVPDDHDPEEGCRFVVEFEKHRSLKGEIVRGFTTWMETPEPTLSDIRPATHWKMTWTTDSRQEEVWGLASDTSVRKIASETGVPRSTVSDWIRKGKRLGKC